MALEWVTAKDSALTWGAENIPGLYLRPLNAGRDVKLSFARSTIKAELAATGVGVGGGAGPQREPHQNPGAQSLPKPEASSKAAAGPDNRVPPPQNPSSLSQ